MSVWICLAIGIVITVVSLAFMRQLFTFLHTPEDLMTEHCNISEQFLREPPLQFLIILP